MPKLYRLLFQPKQEKEFESHFTLCRAQSLESIMEYLISTSKPWFMYPALWRLVEAVEGADA
jgi:hypothetical protein